MVLTLYDLAGNKVAPLYGATDIHIKRVLDGGDETLDFEYPRSAEYAGTIVNEAPIRTDRQEYIIKDVDKGTGAGKIKISCSLNIDDLEGAPMVDGFETVERTLAECMEKALNGTGWRAVIDAGLKKCRTVRIDSDTTAWGVVKQALSTYRCELRIESLEKTLYFAEKRGQDRGSYFYERLGLRSLGVKASSYGFYTRLIPIGKDGIGLWEDGKNYLENHQYSPKVITAIWRDDRYTNTTSLREDAEARLAEASAPVVAYSAEIAKKIEERPEFSVSDYDLGDTVTLCAISLNTKTRQRIVQIDEYPDDPAKNTVELSNVRQTFAQIQKTADEAAKQEAIDISGRKAESSLKENYYTKTEVSTAIQAMADAINLAVAQTYVTVDTLAGYSTTEQMQSAINMSASDIELEVSKTYAKQSSLGDYTKTSEVRSRFAMDSSSVKITSGGIAFNSNTITISSDNFTLDKYGNVTATNVDLEGGITSKGKWTDGMTSQAYIKGGYISLQAFKNENDPTPKQTVRINKLKDVFGGSVSVFLDDRFDASMDAYVGGGFRLFNGGTNDTPGEVVGYLNKESGGAGCFGLLTAYGTRTAAINGNDGRFSLWNTNGKQTVGIYGDTARFTMWDTSGTEKIVLNAETGRAWLRNANGDATVLIYGDDGSISAETIRANRFIDSKNVVSATEWKWITQRDGTQVLALCAAN